MGHLSAIFDLQVSLHLFKRGFQRAIPCKIRSIPVTKVLHACCPAPNNAHTICATHDPPRFRRRWAMESRDQWPKSPTSMSRFRCTAHDLVTSCNGMYVTDIITYQNHALQSLYLLDIHVIYLPCTWDGLRRS